MAAWRRVRSTDPQVIPAARQAVDTAKHALGERGPLWWTGSPDLNRMLAKNSPMQNGRPRFGGGVPEV